MKSELFIYLLLVFSAFLLSTKAKTEIVTFPVVKLGDKPCAFETWEITYNKNDTIERFLYREDNCEYQY